MTSQLNAEERAALAVRIAEDPVSAYNEATGGDWGAGLAKWVPEHMRAGMARYVVFGILPGQFQRAILSGDYFEACRRADDENRRCLFNYAMFLMNYAPQGCFGSEHAVADWHKAGGMLGLEPVEGAPC